MIAIDYSQMKADLKACLDQATNNYETVIVTRKNGKNIVILSEEMYNKILENTYLTSNKLNYDWLMESKKQYSEGKIKEEKLIEEDQDEILLHRKRMEWLSFFIRER